MDDAPSERSDGEGRDTSLRAVLRENWRGLLGAGLRLGGDAAVGQN